MESLQTLAAVITVIMFVVWLFQPFSHIGARKDTTPPSAPHILRLIRLLQPARRETTWRLVRRALIFLSVFLLVLDTIILRTFIIHGTGETSTAGVVTFLVIIFGMPIFLIVDDYRTQRRVRRGERSRVFRWAEIDVVADYESLLLRCLQVLMDIGARLTNFSASIGIIQAELPKHNLVIEIRQIPMAEHYRVYISSDSSFPSVKFDSGANQKIVNDCVCRLLGYK